MIIRKKQNNNNHGHDKNDDDDDDKEMKKKKKIYNAHCLKFLLLTSFSTSFSVPTSNLLLQPSNIYKAVEYLSYVSVHL